MCYLFIPIEKALPVHLMPSLNQKTKFSNYTCLELNERIINKNTLTCNQIDVILRIQNEDYKSLTFIPCHLEIALNGRSALRVLRLRRAMRLSCLTKRLDTETITIKQSKIVHTEVKYLT